MRRLKARAEAAKDKRLALDRLTADARRRRFDVVVYWRLDRLGRNLRHLIALRLQMHIHGAIAEFERGRIVERVRAGLARARTQGVKLGHPRRRLAPERLTEVAALPAREAARRLGIARSTLQRLLA